MFPLIVATLRRARSPMMAFPSQYYLSLSAKMRQITTHPCRSLKYLSVHVQAPIPARHLDSNYEQESNSSSQIVLEVVEGQNYTERKSRKIRKGNAIGRNNHGQYKEKDKYADKLEKDRKIQRNEKKNNLAPEKEEIPHNSNKPYPHNPYYPPYMYPPHPMHMPLGQYPPMYPPYSYPPYQPHYSSMPMPYGPNSAPPGPQNQNGQYKPYLPPPPPPASYPEYMMERPNQNGYKMPPQQMYPYPGYGYPMPYPPYDYYQRQREAHQRAEQLRIARKKEYIDQLRNQLRRNSKDFNGDETYEIFETVKCILKFQDAKPTPTQHSNTQPTLSSNDAIKESIAHRCYQRSLQKVQKWLQGDNPNVREFTKGLLQAMQMGEVILKIKQLKLTRKMQQQSLQSQTKRLLDILVRDPKKMIF